MSLGFNDSRTAQKKWTVPRLNSHLNPSSTGESSTATSNNNNSHSKIIQCFDNIFIIFTIIVDGILVGSQYD